MSTITNRSLEIVRVPVSRMLKAEVAEYASKAMAIVENHVAKESVVHPLLEQLKATRPQIEILGIRYGIDPLREVIENHKTTMLSAIGRLREEINWLSKIKKDDKGLRLVSQRFDSYFFKLRKSKNDKEIHQKISGFVNEIDESEELAEALQTHELITHVNSIRIIKTDLDAAWSKRVRLLSQRPKIKTREIVYGVNAAIADLFKAIEVAHLINPEENNTALVLELSQLSDMFNTSISRRQKTNQRKNSKDKEGNSTEEDPTSAPMTTAMYAGNDWDNDWENDWENDEDEEFAAIFVVEDEEDGTVDETAPEVLHNNEDVGDEDDGVVALE